MAIVEGVTREAIADTYERIRPHIRRTPILEIAAEDLGLAGFAPVLKLELTQHSGSFKARGAFANLLLREVPPAGVAAASGRQSRRRRRLRGHAAGPQGAHLRA